MGYIIGCINRDRGRENGNYYFIIGFIGVIVPLK